jgi:hypothetical protein
MGVCPALGRGGRRYAFPPYACWNRFAKFEAAEAWIPAFAGTARAEVVNFPSRSGYLPSLSAFPPYACYDYEQRGLPKWSKIPWETVVTLNYRHKA